MSTAEKIRSNASYYAELMKSMAALDDVSSALPIHKKYIAYLQRQLAKSQSCIVELGKKEERKRREQEHARNSTTRQLAYRWTGQKNALLDKVAKEERCAIYVFCCHARKGKLNATLVNMRK